MLWGRWPFSRIFMKKVTKVTEIEIEVWTGIDLLIILNKIGQGGSCFAKNGDRSKMGRGSAVEKSLRVWAFQYSESLTMKTEEMRAVREWRITLWRVFFSQWRQLPQIGTQRVETKTWWRSKSLPNSRLTAFTSLLPPTVRTCSAIRPYCLFLCST